jgi:hypothetical protein
VVGAGAPRIAPRAPAGGAKAAFDVEFELLSCAASLPSW